MIDEDDPKWTAYALGEVDAAAREEIDRELERNPEARAYVASIREAIGVVERELQTQPAPALDDIRRQRIVKAAIKPRSRVWLFAGVAVGAAALFAVVVTPTVMRMNDSADRRIAYIDGNYKGFFKTKNSLEFDPTPGVEHYAPIDENGYSHTKSDPLSTFSIDVDTAAYSNIRRFIEQGEKPPADAVRIEEMINYFHYNYPAPERGEPFSISSEVGPSPWDAKHQLVRIGIQTPTMPTSQIPPRNLVFLIDTSGSMQSPNKLPLLVQSLNLVVDGLRAEDHVSIVAYAGAAGLVLPPTTDKDAIRAALARLEAGGSTNGGEGILLAYATARQNFVDKAINRVILCSDGDYNVGTTDVGDLTRMIEQEREHGIFLTVLGFGMGNLKDETMERLADRGNGSYAYIDTISEARKVLVEQAGATFVTVAKDVKIQVEFNPAAIAGYRLIGYENRMLATEDFNNDKKDAGEVGAGQSVTALYEIVPAGVDVPAAKTDDLKYQHPGSATGDASELMTIKVRYKAPDGDSSKLLSRTVPNAHPELRSTSTDYRWAAAIAGFGMMLRSSPFKGDLTWTKVLSLAEGALGTDAEGYRKQALALITRASRL